MFIFTQILRVPAQWFPGARMHSATPAQPISGSGLQEMRQAAGGMLGVVLGSIAIASSGCLAKNEFAPPPPPQVTVAKPEVRTVTVYLEENGQTEAVERAEVTSRVEGIVQS